MPEARSAAPPIRVLNAWRIVSREAQPQNSIITVRGVAFGAEKMLDITTLPERAAAADAFFADPFYLPYSPYAAGGSGNEKEQVRAMQALLQQHHAAGKPVLVRIRDVRQIEPALLAEAVGAISIYSTAVYSKLLHISDTGAVCRLKCYNTVIIARIFNNKF